jgi:N-methylhydantoinase A
MIRVDVGGTFTEILLEQSGQKGASGFVVAEVSSTPHDQSEAVVEASVCGLAGIEPGAIDAVFHGTTVATNMAIDLVGAEVGTITTRGFATSSTWRATDDRVISRCNSTCRGSRNR